MCGIAGLFAAGGARRDWLIDNVTRMTGVLAHRGPDGHGLWLDPQSGVALGHRRLAIVDVSEAGAQPMISASGRFVVTFNGEIYNHRELRNALRGYAYRGRSDTEVLLAAFEQWGVERSAAMFDGMFALAAWDRRERALTLARDRFGEKPLYYSEQDGVFSFASELRALQAGTVDPVAVEEFRTFGFIGAPRTIYREVNKLSAAHTLRTGGTPRRYWSLPTPIVFQGTLDDAADELAARLRHAVETRLGGDVPLGAFLSGGIDSSAIVAMMPRAETFTIGFPDPRYDESPHARAVAAHLGTTHREAILTAADAARVIPSLPDVYDEPFADSSQIPTLLISQFAKRRVTVALAGDGGDELFAGYPRYERLKTVAAIPGLARRGLTPLVRWLARCEKQRMLATALPARNLAALYSSVMGGPAAGAGRDPIDWMTRHDLNHYFADDLLVKLDRASMSVGLETRLPLLEPRLVEFALSLPSALRSSKKVLRHMLARYVPADLINRPKQGFSVPLADWLAGPLKDWAEDLVPACTASLKSGDRCVRLWSELMLAAWLRRPSATPAPRPLESVAVPDRCA